MTQEVEGYMDSEEQDEQTEEQQAQYDQAEWAEVPQKRKQDSLYTLFNKVWKASDSSKVANLGKEELGRPPLMNVRDAQYLALLGLSLKHQKFAAFFNTVSEITLKTSASKKGWFTELFVSQKKFTQRSSSFGNLDQPSTNKKKKWSLFGSNKEEETPQEGQ